MQLCVLHVCVCKVVAAMQRATQDRIALGGARAASIERAAYVQTCALHEQRATTTTTQPASECDRFGDVPLPRECCQCDLMSV